MGVLLPPTRIIQQQDLSISVGLGTCRASGRCAGRTAKVGRLHMHWGSAEVRSDYIGTCELQVAESCEELSPRDVMGIPGPTHCMRFPRGSKQPRNGKQLDAPVEYFQISEDEFKAEPKQLQQRMDRARAVAPAETAKLPGTVVLFDWDDTLFPTWFVTNIVWPCRQEGDRYKGGGVVE